MAVETEKVSKKIKTNKKKKSRVSFEEEVVNKERASELLSQLPKPQQISTEDEEKHRGIQTKQNKSKKQKRKQNEIENVNQEYSEDLDHKQKIGEKAQDSKHERKHKVNKGQLTAKEKISQNSFDVNNKDGITHALEQVKKTKKRKFEKNGDKIQNNIENEKVNTDEIHNVQKNVRKHKKNNADNVGENENQLDVNEPSENSSKTAESKRAKKRKKHLELLEAKKLKATLVTQENVLNYLSKWKHSRSEWKFEKLKQIWLSQNIFDSTKIPDEFWETTLDYFTDARGFIRKLILRDALKVVEDKTEEENIDDVYQTKIKRARDIIQNLQE